MKAVRKRAAPASAEAAETAASPTPFPAPALLEPPGAREELHARLFELEDRLLEFSARIIRVVDALPETRAGIHVAGQLVRCGTLAVPAHGEAQSAESLAESLQHLKMAHKDLREARRWLRLIMRAELISPTEKIQPLLDETTELVRLFSNNLRSAGGETTSFPGASSPSLDR